MAETTILPNDPAFEILAARVPRRVVDEIDSIAKDEDETRSTIVRRLLRRALEHERELAAAPPASRARRAR
jgi:metal-responsive CopG/Arc/MetJ family transcriptional regulator